MTPKDRVSFTAISVRASRSVSLAQPHYNNIRKTTGTVYRLVPFKTQAIYLAKIDHFLSRRNVEVSTAYEVKVSHLRQFRLKSL